MCIRATVGILPIDAEALKRGSLDVIVRAMTIKTPGWSSAPLASLGGG